MSNALRRHHRMQARNARVYSTKDDQERTRERERRKREGSLNAHRRHMASIRATGRTLKVA